jgi:hypothetical protein
MILKESSLYRKIALNNPLMLKYFLFKKKMRIVESL